MDYLAVHCSLLAMGVHGQVLPYVFEAPLSVSVLTMAGRIDSHGHDCSLCHYTCAASRDVSPLPFHYPSEPLKVVIGLHCDFDLGLTLLDFSFSFVPTLEFPAHSRFTVQSSLVLSRLLKTGVCAGRLSCIS